MGQLKRASNPSRERAKTLENTRFASQVGESLHHSARGTNPSQSHTATYGEQVANRTVADLRAPSREILKLKGLRHFSFLAILTQQLSLTDDRPVGWLRDEDKEHG